MKKVWSVLVACALALTLMPMMTLSASAVTEGDFEYTVTNGKAEITKYVGLETHLIIPSKLGGYPVTSIGEWAVAGCKSLTSVKIPNSVKCIGDYAFAQSKSLQSITLMNGVTSIGYQAFWDCFALESIAIPDSVTSIGYDAFGGCASLQSVTIGNGVTCIESGTFNYCTSLASITIPDGITSIGESAFKGCTSLTSITIPNSVTSIESGAFYGCLSLTAITVNTGNMTYCAADGALFTKDKKMLIQYLCGKNEVSYAIPSGVVSIGDNAFGGCEVLMSITISDSVTSIGESAFEGCTSLTSITIPNSVTSIWDGAFYNCDSLTDVYYVGSEAEWNRIFVGDYNSALTSATIHYNSNGTAVKITAQSDTASYASQGAIASATVTAEGDGLSYTWYVKNPGAIKYSKSSVTTATYKTKMTAANAGRLVYCIVNDQYGNEVRSKTFVLRMKATITSEPATAAYAKMGAKVSVAIGAVGDGLKYAWYIKNANGTKYSKSSITSATYSATMSDAVKGRRVYCVVKDKYGKAAQTKTFLLREAVAITAQPKTTTTAKGSIARTMVKASGDGLKYTWYIKNAGQTKYTRSSVTNATYSTVMNNASKNRLVLCVVKDKYGNSVQSTTVKLKMK